ncbi:hypothetical protein AK830_g257 [Neonectria ditissima]|uniref:Phenolic acid decarboxylase n=1 Tax=Neonectria ditissima TaxID=78410 RepID=A0A0P7BQ46_9HYPO|nr:hypothetical protein AK830_g257 [Neonectria ditissima]
MFGFKKPLSHYFALAGVSLMIAGLATSSPLQHDDLASSGLSARAETNQTLPAFLTNTVLDPSFETDMRDVHIIYDYDAEDDQGNPQKWRYELWIFSENRAIYAIHGGPMAGRSNYQTATYQCIRPGELWQINWLEETGTIVSIAYDIPQGKVTTLIGFSKGHWQNPTAAHGDKRNATDFQRWRDLAKIGTQVERFMISEQGTVVDKFRGKGDLVPIAPNATTF